MAGFSPIQQHFVNKTIESNFALWNALLTVNGIMLTAFTILPLVSPAPSKTISLSLVACCLVSLLLIVWNFLSTNRHYRQVGRMLSGSPADLADEQRRANNATEIRQHRNNLLREQVALWLLVGETFLIVILLYLAQG